MAAFKLQHRGEEEEIQFVFAVRDGVRRSVSLPNDNLFVAISTNKEAAFWMPFDGDNGARVGAVR